MKPGFYCVLQSGPEHARKNMTSFWMEKADESDKRVQEVIKEKDLTDELASIETACLLDGMI